MKLSPRDHLNTLKQFVTNMFWDPLHLKLYSAPKSELSLRPACTSAVTVQSPACYREITEERYQVMTGL